MNITRSLKGKYVQPGALYISMRGEGWPINHSLDLQLAHLHWTFYYKTPRGRNRAFMNFTLLYFHGNPLLGRFSVQKNSI